MNHRAGYRSREEAEHSKRYLSDPEHATLDEECFCGLIHVDLSKPAPAPLRARRDTGPDAKTRKAVCTREGWCCAACGISVTGRPHSIQHRVARGMGGTSRPDANAMANLILLCGSATTPGSCHLACEQRDPEMRARGYWLESWENPAEVPVMLFSGHGSGITVLLTPDGEYDRTREAA